jgi:para-nitrobenzyl esterase
LSSQISSRSGARRLLLATLALLLLAATVVATAGAAPTKQKPKPKPKLVTASLVVKTDKGLLRGTTVSGMRAFLGVPYAAPPVGQLRWRPPQDVAPWSGARAATAFGSNCAQAGGTFGSNTSSEDCLYLNVYTPRKLVRGKTYPVMFWIHGGSLNTGSGDSYVPTRLVAHGVVVVTINYRLGLFGFLAHPALTAENGASGDFGFLDQIAALQWVQRNIGSFGGNKSNVTIFGESAGGYSVQALLVSPLAKGLFAKAIDESGTYALQLANPSLGEAEAAGQQAATRMGCPDQSLSCMRNAPTSAVVAANTATTTFAPVDGKVLPTTFAAAFASGNYDHVPVILGTNKDEWALFVAGAEAQTKQPLTADQYAAAIAATIFVPLSTAQSLTVAYPLSAYPTPSNALSALGTDAIFSCNALLISRMLAPAAPTYQYEFADENAPNLFYPGASFKLGAYHAAELPYIFDLTAAGQDAYAVLSPAQRKLASAMVTYWTQFAKTGNPNTKGVPSWPRYSTSTADYQSLAPTTPETKRDFAGEHLCNLWGVS